MKSNKNIRFNTDLSLWPGVCRVQREGQLDTSYILVVLGVVCGACMFKWYMYTHILTWFCWFSWKVVLFIWKLVLFVKSTWKALKTEKHMKTEKQTWKVRSTWKVKSTWKAHENWKNMKSMPEKWKHLKSEKHMKNTWKVKSTTFHEKYMLFIMSFRVIMDFTVDFICWFYYEFHYRFHRNGIHSEIHNEILLISVKSW